MDFAMILWAKWQNISGMPKTRVVSGGVCLLDVVMCSNNHLATWNDGFNIRIRSSFILNMLGT